MSSSRQIHDTSLRIRRKEDPRQTTRLQSSQENFQDEDKDHLIRASAIRMAKLTKRQPRRTLVRNSSPLPLSDELDPFKTLPAKLNRSDEHLINFYLQHYPQLTYGLSPDLKPHPVTTNFGIAMNNPACFQVILARAALYRLSMGKFTAEEEKNELEVALVQHKGHAIRIVRQAIEDANPSANTDESNSVKRREDLIASIISLGTLDKRSGADSTARTHFEAVRKLIRSTGGPNSIQSAYLSRVMCHFECVYGTKELSYVWDRSHNFSPLIGDLNRFFEEVWRLQNGQRVDTSSSTDVTETDKERPGDTFANEERWGSIGSDETLPPQLLGSIPERLSIPSALSAPLIGYLTRSTPNGEPTTAQRIGLLFRLTCLFTLMLLIFDVSTSEDIAFREPASPEKLGSDQSTSMSRETINDLAERFNKPDLEGQPLNNHAWLLQTCDMSAKHAARIWRAAGFVWVLKHASYIVQNDVASYLINFFTKPSEGDYSDGIQRSTPAMAMQSQPKHRPELSETTDPRKWTNHKPFRLAPFHFSYAT